MRKAQAQEILLEEVAHRIGLLLHSYQSHPWVIRLLREVSWGWTMAHLRPGVMENLGDPYSLPAGTKRRKRIRTISDSAGPYCGLLLAFECQVWRVPEWRLGRVTLDAIGPSRPEVLPLGTSGRPPAWVCTSPRGKDTRFFPVSSEGKIHMCKMKEPEAMFYACRSRTLLYFSIRTIYGCK